MRFLLILLLVGCAAQTEADREAVAINALQTYGKECGAFDSPDPRTWDMVRIEAAAPCIKARMARDRGPSLGEQLGSGMGRAAGVLNPDIQMQQMSPRSLDVRCMRACPYSYGLCESRCSY